MKKLLISFVTITWILYSAALCIADDFCPSSIRVASGSISIKLTDDVSSDCGATAGKSTKSDSSEKSTNNYKSPDYIFGESNKSKQGNVDHSITRN
jgi:hypothetical protein